MSLTYHISFSNSFSWFGKFYMDINFPVKFPSLVTHLSSLLKYSRCKKLNPERILNSEYQEKLTLLWRHWSFLLDPQSCQGQGNPFWRQFAHLQWSSLNLLSTEINIRQFRITTITEDPGMPGAAPATTITTSTTTVGAWTTLTGTFSSTRGGVGRCLKTSWTINLSFKWNSPWDKLSLKASRGKVQTF